MGRPKITKISGKLYLRTDRKPDKNGRLPLYLDYTLGSKHARIETTVWIEEKYWDKEKKTVSPKHPQCARLLNQIDKLRREIDDRIFEYNERGARLTIEILRQLVAGKTAQGISSKEDVMTYGKMVMNDEYKLGRIGVSVRDNAYSNFNQFRKFLIQTFKEDSLFVNELTVDLIRQYIMWRQGNGNSNETINKALTTFIKIAKRASEEKLLDSSIAVGLSNLYLKSQKQLGSENEDGELKYLTEKQMAQFVKLYDEVKYNRTRDYMDLFLFSLNSCGLRISDMITLEWASVDLDNNLIRKVLYKSKRLATIPINDKAVAILRHWHTRTGTNRFVFGLLKDDFDLTDDDEAKRMRMNKNRAIGTSLKAIGDKMGLPFNLSIHVARHTFAVWALQRGVDVHKISTLMGHSSVMVTEKVYAKFMPTTLQDEVKSKLNFNY